MLKKIDRVLTEQGVCYYLLGGSTIGALRHGGFIPWDDDVDIAVLRKDFDRAEAAIATLTDGMFYDPVEHHKVADAPLGHLYLSEGDAPENSPRIDVFAIDSVPDKRISQKIQRFYAQVYHVCVLRRASKNRGMAKRIFTGMICALPNCILNALQRHAYRRLTAWSEKPTAAVCNFFGVHGKREVVPTAFYGTPRYVKFEDTQLPIPEKAEEYMTHIYGDYMTLPPEEERVPQHFGAIIKQNSIGEDAD